MLTEHQIRELLDSRETLQKLAEQRFWLLFKYDVPWSTQTDRWEDDPDEDALDAQERTLWVYTPSIDEIEFKKDTVNVSVSARACSRGCCGTQREIYKFPLAYLWTDETTLFQSIQERRLAAEQASAERKRLKAEKEQREHEEWEKEQEELDRQEYERLAAKYAKESQK